LSDYDRIEQILSIIIPQLKSKLTKQMKNGPKTWIQDCGEKDKIIFSTSHVSLTIEKKTI
jgi:hypothetical protein